ncbi:MAG: DNA-binding protein WhiA [Lachnospiraceae bacterium]|nr:DNA-binding protein WhiA [Lachnospiraceae bacterium]MBR1914264.1 DNA-binding protein WhiA [Lachnospiraceae bacterium]
MSFSQDVKKEIKERLSKKNEGFTFSKNADSIKPLFSLTEIFLNKGSVNDPESSYHLEIVCDDADEAATVTAMMTEQGFNARSSVRKGKHIVYLKDREAIADFLGYIGAVGSMMRMENSLILKDMRNSVNRKVNFETANIEKTVNASVRDIEAVRYIEANGGLKQLPADLREIAELRADMPDATLKALGEAMSPPLGKSGVNHRLRRIREFEERLRTKRGENK